MNKVTLSLVAIFVVGVVSMAEAQQPGKIPQIGYLSRRGEATPTILIPMPMRFEEGCGIWATSRAKIL